MHLQDAFHPEENTSAVLGKTAYGKGPCHQLQTFGMLLSLLQGPIPTGGHVPGDGAPTLVAGIELQDKIRSVAKYLPFRASLWQSKNGAWSGPTYQMNSGIGGTRL